MPGELLILRMLMLYLADCGQRGGAMLNVQQIIHRSLECVWRPSDKGLSCVWVEVRGQAASAGTIPADAPAESRKVA